MDIFEAIGTRLRAGTAVTAIVGAQVYHGMRPSPSAALSAAGGCINYFEAGYTPLHNGILESPRYQISCRATTPKVAQNLAREVVVLFHNFSGAIGGFSIQRTTVEGKTLLPEPDTELYHVPVDVRFVYNESTVS